MEKINPIESEANLEEALCKIVAESNSALLEIRKNCINSNLISRVSSIIDAADFMRRLDVFFEVPCSPYVSADVPEGYQTVLGYMYAQNAPLIELAVVPHRYLKKYETKLQSLAHIRKIPLIEVSSPQALKVNGQSKSLAYPIELLKEVLY